jgi:hypothetical protein
MNADNITNRFHLAPHEERDNFIVNFMECYAEFYNTVFPEYHLPERILWNTVERQWGKNKPDTHVRVLAKKLEIAVPLDPSSRQLPPPTSIIINCFSWGQTKEGFMVWQTIYNHVGLDSWKKAWRARVSPDPEQLLYLNHRLRVSCHSAGVRPDKASSPSDFMDYVHLTLGINVCEVNEKISL